MNKFFGSILALIVCVNASCEGPKEEKDQELSQGEIQSQIKWLGEVEGSLPHLYTDLDENVYMSWVVASDDTAKLVYAAITDSLIQEPTLIKSGTDWFVNWADYPMVSTIKGENFLAHYLVKSSEGTYNYDINITVSNDSGQVWSESTILHDDGKEAEHGFVSVVPFKGNFLAVWLDGRNTVTEHSHDTEGHAGAMSLRAAVVNLNGEKIEEWELDNKVCDCCQTSIAMTENGPVVIYRNRSDEEIRDMYAVRLINNEWTDPKPIYNDNWNIAGCPVNGPRISAKGNNAVVTWFTAASEPRVNVVFTSDGGANFTNPVRLDSAQAIGRVDAVMLDDTRAFITWMEGENIKAALVTSDGNIVNRYVIAHSSTSRSSGFPQITYNGKSIVVAFTDTSSGTVKTGIITI